MRHSAGQPALFPRSPSSHSKWTWSGSATGPVETKRGNGAKTPTTPTLKNARHVHVTTPVAIPRQWANRQRQEASEGEGPRRRRLRARLASCSTLCLHRLKQFISRYADYFMLFSLDYSYSIIKWSLMSPSIKLILNSSNTLGKKHQPKGKGMSPSSARARRTPTRPNSTLM